MKLLSKETYKLYLTNLHGRTKGRRSRAATQVDKL
jgi:hypothetical protein